MLWGKCPQALSYSQELGPAFFMTKVQIEDLLIELDCVKSLCVQAADALQEHSWKEPRASTDELIDELRKAAE